MNAPRPHSLRSKLGLLLVVLFLVVGSGVLLVVLRGAGRYSDEVNHRLNHDAAAHIVNTIEPFEAGAGKTVNQDALKGVFMNVMVVNPTLEVYLIDRAGAVLAYDAPEEKILRPHVDVTAAQRFLDQGGAVLVLGDDPRSLTAKKPISVAAVRRDGALAGYLYIILGGEAFDGVTGALQESYILRWGLGLILGAFLVAGLVGLGALGALTRPLERLRAAMQHFRDDGRVVPLEVATSDEIGALTADFNQMAARIADQVEVLRVTDEERRRFVANISHDLRTPTATVKGYLETLLIRSGSLDPDERERYLRIALRQAERLGTLVDELFELARLEARDAEPAKETFNLAELASDVAAKFAVAAREAGHAVRFEVDESGALEVEGDPGLIERVLNNLIDNALGHSPAGGAVTVSVRAGAKGDVEVRVRDEGPGVPEAERARIFERFFRGPSAGSSHRTGGSGLGLAIVHRVVELHGGSVSVEDWAGGASFLVRLPAIGEVIAP